MRWVGGMGPVTGTARHDPHRWSLGFGLFKALFIFTRAELASLAVPIEFYNNAYKKKMLDRCRENDSIPANSARKVIN
jgi:hypothetical protein